MLLRLVFHENDPAMASVVAFSVNELIPWLSSNKSERPETEELLGEDDLTEAEIEEYICTPEEVEAKMSESILKNN